MELVAATKKQKQDQSSRLKKGLRFAFSAVATVAVVGYVGACGYNGVDTMIGHTDPEGATAALTKEGYTDIEITGKEFFLTTHCPKYKDWNRTKFTAENKDGEQVKGVVCSSRSGKYPIIRISGGPLGMYK